MLLKATGRKFRYFSCGCGSTELAWMHALYQSNEWVSVSANRSPFIFYALRTFAKQPHFIWKEIIVCSSLGEKYLLVERTGILEFSTTRCPRKGDDIANILHSRCELHSAFQSQAKPGMRHSAIFTEVDVPPVFRGIKVLLSHAVF